MKDKVRVTEDGFYIMEDDKWVIITKKKLPNEVKDKLIAIGCKANFLLGEKGCQNLSHEDLEVFGKKVIDLFLGEDVLKNSKNILLGNKDLEKLVRENFPHIFSLNKNIKKEGFYQHFL